MTALTVEQYYGALVDAIGKLALQHVTPKIRSRTLQRAIRYYRTTFRSGRLFIPHFWAIYQHDGRGPVKVKNARSLVFFVNPADDPRLAGGYPIKLSQIKKLTKEQFRAGMQENARLYADNPSGGRMQHMVYVESVKKTGPGKSYKFFEDGMRDFVGRVHPLARRHMQDLVRFARRRIRETAALSI